MATDQDNPKITDAQRQAMRTFAKLMRATNSVEARLRPALGEDGLTESQFGVLEVLYSLGPLCQRAIGEKILKTSGNITLVIDNLEKQDLVLRKRSTDDRRHVLVSLTDKGRALISDIFPRHALAIEQAMSALSDDEQEQFGYLCRKLGRGKRPESVPYPETIETHTGNNHEHTNR